MNVKEVPAAAGAASPPMGDDDLLEAAWGLIANASSGNWSKQSQEWQEAAKRWRTRYFDRVAPPPDRPRGFDVRTLYQALVRVWPRTFGNRLSWSQPSIDMAAAATAEYERLSSAQPTPAEGGPPR